MNARRGPVKTNLVSHAHAFARERYACAQGRHAVDATAGNGHDTLFLAQLVGENGGRVAAFDIQAEAITATQKRLEKNGFAGLADLFLCGHEKMAEVLPATWRGDVCAIFFNLGYLPRSSHEVKTRAKTTLPALCAAWELLAPGGFISLAVYTRHSGGFEESEKVEKWLNEMRSRAEIFTLGGHNPVEPWWAGIVKPPCLH